MKISEKLLASSGHSVSKMGSPIKTISPLEETAAAQSKEN